jgi:hypothetical protein
MLCKRGTPHTYCKAHQEATHRAELELQVEDISIDRIETKWLRDIEQRI